MFLKLLNQFNSNINGLREFVELIQPMLDEYHKSEREKYDKAFLPLAIAHKIHLEEDEDLKLKLKNELNEMFDGEIEVTTKPLDEEDKEEEVEKKLAFRIKGDTSKIDDAFDFQVKSSEQQDLLYVNSFINLLSSAEWFYSQILHFYYDQNPNSAGVKKKTLTLEELKSFGSVEDAEKYLIDSKIEGLLRSSFSDWMETLKIEVKLGLGYLDDFNDELIEIYQRRNLLVHNGGIVNSIYLSKVSQNLREKVETGVKLTVDETYLDNAINKIHVLFSLIACELWKKQLPEDDERSDYLMSLNYQYLKRKNWNIAKLPNIFLSGDAKQPTIPKTYAKLNCWLCQKRTNDSTELKKELEKVDFSDKTIIIQLALASLKDDEETFFKLLPKAINSDELDPESLFDFPIFEEMRENKKFEDFQKENEKIIEYLKEKNVAQQSI